MLVSNIAYFRVQSGPYFPTQPTRAHFMENIESAKLAPYGLLNTPAEMEYDAVTKLVSSITGAPMVFINLVQDGHQFFKSAHGVGDLRYMHDPTSFCTYTIKVEGDHFEVENALMDDRFKDNPLVAQEPHVRSYFGIPLRTEGMSKEDEALGSLCILDTKPRVLSEIERNALRFLADYTCRLFEMRKERLALRSKSTGLERQNEELRLSLIHI